MYNVDIKEILRNNPEANEGLRIDQVIKVPFKKAKVQRVEKNKLQQQQQVQAGMDSLLSGDGSE